MTNRQVELALKRGRLLERIASQRATLAMQAIPIANALDKTDRAIAVGRTGIDYVKHHPAQVGAAIAILAILHPKRVWRWGRRAFVAWGVWKKVRDRLGNTGLIGRHNTA